MWQQRLARVTTKEHIFIAVFAGYSTGAAPIVGYHYGAGNHGEIRNMLRKSMTLMGAIGVLMTTLGVLLARPIASIFVGYDAQLMELTVRAFRICAIPFLVMGVNIYASSFFTALNNGGVSAAISFLRSLIILVVSIIVLPILFGLDGVWLTMPVGEVLTLIVSVAFLLANRKKYHY